LEVVRELLEWGAAVDAADDDGDTPLHVACRFGRLEVVHQLLARGALPNFAANDGSTALSLATYRGHAVIVQLLRSAPRWSTLEA